VAQRYALHAEPGFDQGPTPQKKRVLGRVCFVLLVLAMDVLGSLQRSFTMDPCGSTLFVSMYIYYA
jgi:hypothetical protein